MTQRPSLDERGPLCLKLTYLDSTISPARTQLPLRSPALSSLHFKITRGAKPRCCCPACWHTYLERGFRYLVNSHPTKTSSDLSDTLTSTSVQFRRFSIILTILPQSNFAIIADLLFGFFKNLIPAFAGMGRLIEARPKRPLAVFQISIAVDEFQVVLESVYLPVFVLFD